MTDKELLEKADSQIDSEVMDAMLGALYVASGASGIPWRMLGLNQMPSHDSITRAAAAMAKD